MITAAVAVLSLTGCVREEEACLDSVEVTDTAEVSTESPEMSECGQQVLSDNNMSYSDCFTAEGDFGACETCGYYTSVDDSQGAYDCITCEEGYEIEVEFDDCTGYCVPKGTASTPITREQCNAVSECVYDQ